MRELGVHVQATRSINAVWSSQRAEWHRWGGQPQKDLSGTRLAMRKSSFPSEAPRTVWGSAWARGSYEWRQHMSGVGGHGWRELQ